MKNSSVPPTFGDVPPHVYDLIVQFLLGAVDDDVDLREAHIRTSIKDFFPFIIFVYGLIVVVGVVSNIVLMVHVIWHKLCKDATYAFIINNAVSDIVKCVIVLPISLYVLVVQNWMLGELLCSFLPMMQDIPFHVTTLTFVLTAWDRYRFVRNPNKPRLPSFVCAVGSWLTALCLVLPYPIYIIYVDLGRYSNSFHGIGFCVVNLTDDMQEYMRGIFLIMYAGPLATISYLYVKGSRELQTTATIVMYETRHRESRSRPPDSQRTSIDMRGSRGESDLLSQYSRSSYRSSHPVVHPGSNRIPLTAMIQPDADFNGEIELDVGREKRTNKYLATMVTMYAIFMCPLMILRVARLALLETYENAGHFDLTYTAFVWFAFLPTCTTPALFAAWHTSRPTKERLRGYFRISNRKIRRSCDITTETSCVSTPPPTAAGGTAAGASTHSQFVRTASNRSSNRSSSRHLPQLPPSALTASASTTAALKQTMQLELQPRYNQNQNQRHLHSHSNFTVTAPAAGAVAPVSAIIHPSVQEFEYYAPPLDLQVNNDLIEIYPDYD